MCAFASPSCVENTREVHLSKEGRHSVLATRVVILEATVVWGAAVSWIRNLVHLLLAMLHIRSLPRWWPLLSQVLLGRRLLLDKLCWDINGYALTDSVVVKMPPRAAAQKPIAR